MRTVVRFGPLLLVAVLLGTAGTSRIAQAARQDSDVRTPITGPSLNPEEDLNNYVHRSWSIQDDLPQSSVNDIIQTPDGYLWIATFGGLIRFDGTHFTSLHARNRGVDHGNRVTALGVDPAGNLWFGAETGEVVKLSGDKYDLQAVIGDGPIVSIDFLSTGEAVVGSFTETGLLQNGEYTRIVDVGRSATVTDDDAIWVTGVGRTVRIANGRVTRELSISGGVTAQHDSSGILIAGMRGIHVMNDGDGLLQPSRTLVPNDTLGAVLMDRGGTIWAGTGSGDLLRISGDQVEVSEGFSDVPGTQINALFEDREGNLWIGTEANGLHQLTANWLDSFTRLDGVMDQIGRVADGPDGRIWLSGDCGMMYALDENDRIDVLTEWGRACGRDFVRSENGSLWMSNGSTLVHFNGREPIVYRAPWEITQLALSPDGTLWLAARDRGLGQFDSGTFKLVYESPDPLRNKIESLFLRKNGVLWIGTYSGLGFFSNGEMTWYTTADGLPYRHVRDVYEDRYGGVWISIYGGGIGHYHDEQFTFNTADEGLCDDFVSMLRVDTVGRIWGNSNSGVFFAYYTELDDFMHGRQDAISCTILDADMGVVVPEGKRGGGVTADGRIWFPNVGGVSVLDPVDIPENPVPPRVEITSVQFDGDLHRVQSTLELPRGRRDFEIRYTGITFKNPSRARFFYRLVGYHDNWRPAGNRRVVYYTNLDPGEYRFEVRTQTIDGQWSTSKATLKLIIPSYFWELWWVQALIITVIVGLILGAAIVRNRILDKRARALRSEVRTRRKLQQEILNVSSQERQRIGQDIHDGLGQQLTGMRFLASALESRLEKSEDAAVEDVRELLGMISSTMMHTRFLARSLLPKTVEEDGLSAHLTELCAQIDELFDVSSDFEEKGGVEVTGEQSLHLSQIAREAATNAVRHAGASRISIKLESSEAGVMLTVQDDGCGFDMDAVKPGLGMRIMRYRSELLGATLTVSNREMGGTSVRCLLPYND